MKFKTKYLYYFLILLPFLLVFIAEILSFRNQSLGSSIKLFSIIYMVVFSLLKSKFDFQLILALFIFSPFLIYHIFISFNINAAIEEAIRYLFPIVVIFYGYSIRKHYLFVIHFIIFYAVLNNLYQPIAYFNWFRDVHEQWFYNKVEGKDIYYYNEIMGVLRGVGLVGFFAAYGFLNLIAYFLTKHFYYGKGKRVILIVLILGVIFSLSFKAMGVFVFLLFVQSKYKGKLTIAVVGLFLLLWVFLPQKMANFYEQLSVRIETYITEGNSARSESYRVMIQDIADFKLIGRGVGSFGGSASTKYNSPVYKEVDFNWYKTKHIATTDTYFPHVFVELGIIGGLLYFLVILSPILKRYYKKEILILVFIIYFSLLFDSVFSFALNNLVYLMVSLVLVYPILEYEKSLSIHNIKVEDDIRKDKPV